MKKMIWIWKQKQPKACYICEKLAKEKEIAALLSAEHDSCSCYLEIQAGAGGTESMDWAAMVLLMYKMWAQNHGFKVTIVDDVSSCFQVNDCDLRIERFRSGGPGG